MGYAATGDPTVPGQGPRHEEQGCALILFCGFKWEEGSHEGAWRKHCGRAGNRNPGPPDLIFHSAPQPAASGHTGR